MKIVQVSAAVVLALAGATVALAPQVGAATTIEVKGTHSAEAIQAVCDTVGGTFYQKASAEGGSYGCYNQQGSGGTGSAVDCNNEGYCVGTMRTIGTQTKGDSAQPPVELIDALKP